MTTDIEPGRRAGEANSLTGQRVFITGGFGFVGKKLISRLRAHAPLAQVVLAGRSVGTGHDAVEMDIEDPDSVSRAVASAAPDIVVHLAAQSSVGQAQSTAGQTWSVNASGTLNLARAVAAQHPDATLLFASSAEVYGAAFNLGEASEETLPEPQSAYSRSKLACEMILGDVLTPANTLIVVRPSNHSGRGQDRRFVLPSFAEQIATGQSQIRVGNLAAERDFLHVDDVVDAYIGLLEAADRIAQRSVFNVASGSARSIGSLLERMIALADSPATVVVDQDRLRVSDVPVASLSAKRLRDATGWRPSRSVDDMLREVLEAWS